MSQTVQDLIDKIKLEGIDTAKKDADDIKGNAEAEAEKIIENAKKQAEQIGLEAESQVKKTQESTTLMLQQASRDTLLALKKEIQSVLKNIIKEDIKASLQGDELAKIIEQVVGHAVKEGNVSSIDVCVNAKDLEKLKKGCLSKLNKKIKDSVTLRSSDEVGSGFTISYDDGKSSFEFTDESLAGYMSTFLNAQVSSILNDSIKSK